VEWQEPVSKVALGYQVGRSGEAGGEERGAGGGGEERGAGGGEVERGVGER